VLAGPGPPSSILPASRASIVLAYRGAGACAPPGGGAGLPAPLSPRTLAILRESAPLSDVTTTLVECICTSNFSPLPFSFLTPSMAIRPASAKTRETLPSTSLYSPRTTLTVSPATTRTLRLECLERRSGERAAPSCLDRTEWLARHICLLRIFEGFISCHH